MVLSSPGAKQIAKRIVEGCMTLNIRTPYTVEIFPRQHTAVPDTILVRVRLMAGDGFRCHIACGVEDERVRELARNLCFQRPGNSTDAVLDTVVPLMHGFVKDALKSLCASHSGIGARENDQSARRGVSTCPVGIGGNLNIEALRRPLVHPKAREFGSNGVAIPVEQELDLFDSCAVGIGVGRPRGAAVDGSGVAEGFYNAEIQIARERVVVVEGGDSPCQCGELAVEDGVFVRGILAVDVDGSGQRVERIAIGDSADDRGAFTVGGVVLARPSTYKKWCRFSQKRLWNVKSGCSCAAASRPRNWVAVERSIALREIGIEDETLRGRCPLAISIR